MELIRSEFTTMKKTKVTDGGDANDGGDDKDGKE